MRALKLVQYMKMNADRMSEKTIELIRNSDKCREFLLKVPVEEQKQSNLEIYRDLIDWLATETDSSVRARYVALGRQRAQQGVPFTDLFWAVCVTQEHLWEYIQQECLVDEPVEFWGGVNMLRSLTQFFDRALYFALLGYQKASNGEFAAAPPAFASN
jgi:hypothetical protein